MFEHHFSLKLKSPTKITHRWMNILNLILQSLTLIIITSHNVVITRATTIFSSHHIAPFSSSSLFSRFIINPSFLKTSYTLPFTTELTHSNERSNHRHRWLLHLLAGSCHRRLVLRTFTSSSWSQIHCPSRLLSRPTVFV